MTSTIADPKPGRWCAAALLVTSDGRYLMQRRDAFDWINFADHWACFGGMIEPGETPEAAIRREIGEELSYRVGELELFTEYHLVLPFREPRLERVTFSRSRSAQPRLRRWSSTKAPIWRCCGRRSLPPKRGSSRGISLRC